MPGWIFRRQATASATALFGLWPDSSMRLAEVVRHHCWRLATARCGAPAFIAHYIRRGGPSSPSSTRLTTSTDLHLSLCVWLWRGPRMPLFLSLCACVLRGNPGSTLRLWSDGGYASEESWQISMVAWRTVATSEDGGHPCCHVSTRRWQRFISGWGRAAAVWRLRLLHSAGF